MKILIKINTFGSETLINGQGKFQIVIAYSTFIFAEGSVYGQYNLCAKRFVLYFLYMLGSGTDNVNTPSNDSVSFVV